MSYLRGSANYVWCTTSVLGKGATGAVFQGVSKHDGEPVAVKTFNQLSHMRPQEVQVREFEVLKKVKHENIVKLLAIEEEQDGRGKVIVMELCTGGSLYNLLDHPENTYGLCEDDFLLVLSHLSAGMRHLRDNKLVHRDLKPGNIMKYVAEDGRVIFKLTDFGAARELEEDQEFMSLYGTEEYLHPDMYERAVLRKPVGKTFSASVDLWSIGVTLYHVATGYLPFRPYGGRKNKEMMHFITTKKESGVISGVQTTENGPVDWKRDLPNSCQLSAGLKILITPLLAGLMEADQRKRWTYDSFFRAVDRILCRKIVHIFYVNKVQSLRIYMDLEEHRSLVSFKNLVMEQTEISAENQILLYKDMNLTSVWEKGNRISSVLPSTSEDNPLILCHRENNNVSLDWDIKDLLKFPTFPNLVNVENDASLAKLCCSVGYSYRRRVEKICRCVSLISVAVKTIDEVITAELTTLSRDSNQIQSVVHSIEQQLDLMNLFQKTSQSFLVVIPNAEKEKAILSRIESIGKCNDSQHTYFRRLTTKLNALEQPIKQLFNRFVEAGTLKTEWSEPTMDVKDISRASKKGASHVSKLQDSWQHLLRDRATRSLTYNDEQFHILERIKMQEKSKCLSELLNEECQLVIIKLTEVLSDWYKQAQAAFIQTEILAKDMIQFEKDMNEFRKTLDDAVESYQVDLEHLTGSLKQLHQQNKQQVNNSSGGSANKEQQRQDPADFAVKSSSLDPDYHGDAKTSQNRSQSREHAKSMRKGIKDLCVLQEEVWNMVKENADLVNQFQALTLSLFSTDVPYGPSLSTDKSESDLSAGSGKSE